MKKNFVIIICCKDASLVIRGQGLKYPLRMPFEVSRVDEMYFKLRYFQSDLHLFYAFPSQHYILHVSTQLRRQTE